MSIKAGLAEGHSPVARAEGRSIGAKHSGDKSYEGDYFLLQHPELIPNAAAARSCLAYCNRIIANRTKLLADPELHRDVIKVAQPDLEAMKMRRANLMNIWGKELSVGNH